MKMVSNRKLIVGLHLVAAVVVVALFAGGLPYYLSPLSSRPRHELYWILKPGGERGHLLGIVGSLMMIAMLSYSLRKRWSSLHRLGSLSKWLDVHIFFGIWGPLLVILHSSFKVNGLVAVSFWSMVAVALSGVFGRFLYVQIPRAQDGDELSANEAKELDDQLSRMLIEDYGLDSEALDEVNDLAERGIDLGASLPVLFALTVLDPLVLRRRLRPAWRSFHTDDPALRRRFVQTVMRKAALRRRMLLWDRVRELFHYWHVLHKPFAVLMYLFMVVHVAVAVATGYAL